MEQTSYRYFEQTKYQGHGPMDVDQMSYECLRRTKYLLTQEVQSAPGPEMLCG